MPTWTLDSGGGRIVRAEPAGQIVEVPALDIWDAQFEPKLDLRWNQPSKDLPEIEFNQSFLVLEPALDLSRDGFVRLHLRESGSGRLLDVWPHSDQIVLGLRWSALDSAYLDSLEALLAPQNISLGENLTAQQLVWLYWESGLGVESDIDSDVLSSAFAQGSASSFEPRYLTATLYSYQHQGAALLASMADQGLGALLADEMGLGKTIQAIYLLVHRVATAVGPCLVVVPSSTIANWQREVAKFAPHLSVGTHLGSARSGVASWFGDYDVTLTTYDIAVRDSFLFASVEWDLVVLDEAQMIKNANAQRAIAVKALPRKISLAITGTPIENSLTDMWSIMDFVAPHYLGDKREFENRFPDDVVAAMDLSQRIAPMIIRRTVAQVATDLPQRIDIPTPIFVSERLERLYEDIRRRHGQKQLAALTYLRQVCACPTAVDGTWPSVRVDFPKYDRLMEIITEIFAEHGKALVFASFTEPIDALAAAFRYTFPGAFVETVDGRRNSADRQDSIDQFTSWDGPGVLVLNPKAAGVGLNIQAANHVVHFTPEWNPATVAQASARAHRRGQTLPVFVHYLYYSSTVEEVMMDRMDMKRSLQSAGMSQTGSEPELSDIARALEISPKGQMDD
jgi:SNF2 family DNA or RNA helicase